MITLTKDGAFFSEYKDGKRKEIKETIIPYIGGDVIIEKGFTLEHLFSWIEKEVKVYETVFHCDLGGHFLSPYIEEINKEHIEKKESEDSKIEYLELQHVAEQFEYEGVNEIQIYVDFHGFGHAKDQFTGEIREEGIALEFTPLNELKHYNIVLNNEFYFWKKGKEYKEKILEGVREFSLYKVIGSIFSEISFFGNPKSRNGQLQDLRDTQKDIDKRMKAGEKVGKPWENLKQELENKKKGIDMKYSEKMLETEPGIETSDPNVITQMTQKFTKTIKVNPGCEIIGIQQSNSRKGNSCGLEIRLNSKNYYNKFYINSKEELRKLKEAIVFALGEDEE